MFKKYLHEPLVHFLVLGGLIFLIYAYINDGFANPDATIFISQAEINQLHYRWQKKYFREPSKEEKQKMIDKAVYDEVIYKEALKMGLDKNDLIIQRRLVQKLEFLSSDLSTFVKPSDTELQEYLDAHSQDFMLPEKIEFLQVFVDPRKYEGQLDNYFTRLKKKLINTPLASLEILSDNKMLPVHNPAQTQKETARQFGRVFAEKLHTLALNSWQGPVKSAYGFHFVYIQSKQESKISTLQSIKALVRSQWMAEEQTKNNQKFYDNIKASYTIKIQE